MIDVAMGGRAAEEIGEPDRPASSNFLIGWTVYGPKNVTSGCSSDIKNATNVATGMVRVCWFIYSPSLLLTRFDQYYGYSDALGPVFFGDDVSSAKRNVIDTEIRK